MGPLRTIVWTPTAQRLTNLEKSEPGLAPSRLPLQPTVSRVKNSNLEKSGAVLQAPWRLAPLWLVP